MTRYCMREIVNYLAANVWEEEKKIKKLTIYTLFYKYSDINTLLIDANYCEISMTSAYFRWNLDIKNSAY